MRERDVEQKLVAAVWHPNSSARASTAFRTG